MAPNSPLAASRRRCGNAGCSGENRLESGGVHHRRSPKRAGLAKLAARSGAPLRTSAKRLAAGLLGVLMFFPMMGCRLCGDADQHAYPAYGGAWQRTLRETGRVGSIFDPAGAKAPELVDRDRPPEIDTIQRRDRRDEAEPSDESAEEPREPGEDETEVQPREDSLEDLQLQDIRYEPPRPAPPGLH